MARIRVTFSLFPLSADSQAAHDALNSGNYTLTGPGAVTVAMVQSVSGDLASVDLLLSGQLTVGAWTVTASNVRTALGEVLVVNQAAFEAVSITTLPVADGAQDATAEDILHRNLNPALVGKAWDALIAALAVGDSHNWENARLAFDQMFKSSATGKYLDRKTGDDGVSRPLGVGMSDDLFRKLAIVISSVKLTQESLLEILEIFYGSDSVRGAVTTDLVAPFALNDGDDLHISLDEELDVVAIFQQADFASIGAAKAVEVAAALNRTFALNTTNAFATVWIDAALQEHVKVYSGSLGHGSSIRVLGGRAQNSLQFPHRIQAYNAGGGALPTWNITTIPEQSRLRFTSAGTTGLDLNLVREGDYVNIYGSEFFAANRGSYVIVKVYVAYPAGVLTQYFEIVNRDGVAQAGLAQVADEDLYYFRPVRAITSKRNGVSVSQANGEVFVDLPATTEAVNRGYLTAAYANANPAITASNLVRKEGGTVSITATAHGLTVGKQVEVIGAAGSTSQPTTTAGSGIAPYTTSYSLGTVWSPLVASSVQRRDHAAIKLADGRVLIAGGYSDGTGQYLDSCELFTITATATVSGASQYTYTIPTAGALPAARAHHTLSLMSHPVLDSKALLVGGFDGAVACADTYLYTPAAGAGAWTATTSLGTARYDHATVLLADGGVLVSGGNAGGVLSSCELLDPLTMAWAGTGTMVTPRQKHTTTTLQNGNVLACGGLTTGGAATFRAEVYNATTGLWSATGGMSYARSGHAAALLPDGRVLVVGGTGFLPRDGAASAARIAECEVWNPATGIWSSAGRMGVARNSPTVALLGNVLMVSGGGSVVTELLDWRTMTWSRSRASLPDVRDGAPGVVLDNGTVYAAFGDKAGVSQAASALLVTASERIFSGGLNGQFRVSAVPDDNTIEFQTPERTDRTVSGSFQLYPVGAQEKTTLGPHVFDPQQGPAITSHVSTITQDLTKGQRYGFVDVADSSAFPDQDGWLCFAFGAKQQVTPVHYFGRLSSTRLKLDFRFVFPRTVPSGATVTLLKDKGAWTPAKPEEAGALYVTGSNAGVAAASSLVDEVLAAGIKAQKRIVYPGDRGLGGEGLPATGDKISDKVQVWGSDSLDQELATAKGR